jgi:hypothetical protein
MALIGNWIETYLSKKTGKYMFVYIVSGTEEEKLDLKLKQGQFFRETPDGRPKYSTPFYGGKVAKIVLTYDKSKYIMDNSEYDKQESLAKQFGGNLNISLAEKSKDINWILDIDNKVLDQPEKNKLSKEQIEKIELLRKLLEVKDKIEITQKIVKSEKNYFSKDLGGSGFTFLNEWHFAAYVKNNLNPAKPLIFKIVKLTDPMLDPFFSGILQDENGNQYNIEEPENIWMFGELLDIAHLSMRANIKEGYLSFEIPL